MLTGHGCQVTDHLQSGRGGKSEGFVCWDMQAQGREGKVLLLPVCWGVGQPPPHSYSGRLPHCTVPSQAPHGSLVPTAVIRRRDSGRSEGYKSLGTGVTGSFEL